MFKKGHANEAARQAMNKNMETRQAITHRAQAENTMSDGYYWHSPEEEYSYALSIFDGKAILEFNSGRDVDILDSSGIDLGSEDTIDIQEGALGAGQTEVSADELQQLLAKSGIQFDLKTNMEQLSRETTRQAVRQAVNPI